MLRIVSCGKPKSNWTAARKKKVHTRNQGHILKRELIQAQESCPQGKNHNTTSLDTFQRKLKLVTKICLQMNAWGSN